MKTLRISFVTALVLQALAPVFGQSSPIEIGEKYREHLLNVFQFQARIVEIHPVFQLVKLYRLISA